MDWRRCANLLQAVTLILTLTAVAARGFSLEGAGTVIIVNTTPVPDTPHVVIVPSTLFTNESCVFVGTLETIYTLWGGVAAVLLPPGIGSFSIVSNGGCKPEEPGSLLLAYLGYGAQSPVSDVSWAPNGYYDVGAPVIDSSGYYTRLTFYPPYGDSAVSVKLGFGEEINPREKPLTIHAFVTGWSGNGIVLGVSIDSCGYPGFAIISQNGDATLAVFVDGELKPVYHITGSSLAITMILYNNTAMILANDKVVYYDKTIDCRATTGLILYQAASSNPTPSVTAYTILYAYVGLPVEYETSTPNATVALEGPSTLIMGAKYTYNITIYGTGSGIAALYAPGIGVLNETEATAPSKVSLEVTTSSAILTAGYIAAVFVANGTLQAIYSMRVSVVPSLETGQSWVLHLTLEYGEHGIVVYSDGTWKRFESLPYTLALIGPGYAGCSISLIVDSNNVYSLDLASTVTDVLIPFNFSTPAKVVITKSVTSTGCSVTVQVTTLEYYKVIVNPVGAGNETREPQAPGVGDGYSLLSRLMMPMKPEERLAASILVSSLAAAVAIMALRMGQSLSTAILYTGLMLFAISLLIGGSMLAHMLTVSVILIGIGLGLKLKLG